MNLCGVEVGHDQPCRFVAELSNNHNGDFFTAVQLIYAAKAAGADFVKFQAYTPEELVALRGDGPAPEPWGSQGWTMARLYAKAQTPREWFPDLVKLCGTIGMPWFSSVFGAESLAMLEGLGCPAYKIASLDAEKRSLADRVYATGKPVVSSQPAAVPPRVLGPYREMGIKVCPDVRFLYCPAGYPQPALHLRNIRNGYDGFSYHGTDPLAPVMAAAMGAQIIECHLQLHDQPSELEANVSLDERQFADMVAMVRKLEAWR